MAKTEVVNYATKKSVTDRAAKLYAQIEAGYQEEKKGQSKSIEEFWDIYNCELGENQQYDGDSQIYEPIVRDALEARRKRFTGMLFPNVGQNIECVSEEGDTPQSTLSVLQRHVFKMDLRSIASTLFLNGDIEGQWSVMMDWSRKEREITRATKDLIENSTEEKIDIKKETVVDEGPDCTVIAAQDLWVYPATVSNIQDAEIVSVALRLTDDAIDDMVEEGILLKSAVKQMSRNAGDDKDKWAAKARSSEAGVKIKAGQKFCLIYMVFTKMKLEDKKVPSILFLGGPDNVLGCIKNPHWSQKIPIISEPVDKVAGSFWGKSKVQPVAPLQYQLNDIGNIGMDAAMFSIMPIVLTDPVKNPRIGSMMMAVGAIWETSPADTKILDFPPIYQHALTLRSSIKQQIMESMEVNETMLGVAPKGRKNASAVGQQSSESLATIGSVVKRFEQVIMNPILEWNYELDLQYREEDLLIVTEGEHGSKTILEKIPPQQVSNRYWFRWIGADAAMGAQRVQQMIAAMNVFRGIPPQMLNGRKLDIGPIVDFIAQAAFGPTMAQNVLIDQRHVMTVPPEIENEMLLNNHLVNVNPEDSDIEHIQAHQQAALRTGDMTGIFRHHMAEHAKALQQKQAQQMPKGQPGVPGGAGPGVAGSPRPGAMPGEQRMMQNPPGAIHADNMVDPQAGMRG